MLNLVHEAIHGQDQEHQSINVKPIRQGTKIKIDSSKEENEFLIKLYPTKGKKELWTDKDSDDSFSIEPTNIGEFHRSQK